MLRLGLTLILLLLNILWISFYAYIKTHPAPIEPIVKLQMQSILPEVEGIEITNLNEGTTYQFKKEDSAWKLTKPFHWNANPIAVESFLQAFMQFDPKINFKVPSEDTATLGTYGLKPPAFSLKITGTQRIYTLLVGQNLKANEHLYLYEPETQTVFVSALAALDPLFFVLDQWCDAHIFENRLQLENIQNLTYDTPNLQVYLVNEASQWWLKHPVYTKASDMHVEAILYQIRNLEVKSFLKDERVVSYSVQLKDQTQHSTLTLANDTRAETLKIVPYDEAKHIYVGQLANYDKLFLFKSTWVARLQDPQETLRERRIFNFDISSIQEINCSHTNTQLALKKLEANKWEVLQYEQNNLLKSERADTDEISNFLKTLKTSYVEKFWSDTDTLPFDKSQSKHLQIKLIDEKGNVVQSTFYCTDKDIFLKIKEDPTLLQLTQIDPDFLNISFEKLRNKEIWHWKEDEHIVSLQWISFVHPLAPNSLLLQVNKEQESQVLKQAEANLRTCHAKRFIDYATNVTLPTLLSSNVLQPNHLQIKTIDSTQTIRTYDLYLTERFGDKIQWARYGHRLFELDDTWVNTIFILTELPEWVEKAENFNSVFQP